MNNKKPIKKPIVNNNNPTESENLSNDQSLFESIFSFKVSSLDAKNQKEEFIYYPSAEKGIDKTYTSYVKFVPNVKNPSKSLTRKWVVLLENPLYDEKRYIDCPSSVNEFSILQQTFFVLYNSQDPFIREKANYFKRREVFYSYIYIVNDEIDQSYNDKILIFRFGRQIYDILVSAENDSLSPIKIYDIFAPYVFKINVIEKSGYNHYSRSKFIERYFPIKINNTEITKNNYKILIDYIKSLNFSPDMYEYKPWDEDTTKYVLETIYTIVDDIKLLRKIFKNQKELYGVPIDFEKSVILIDGYKDSPNEKIEATVSSLNNEFENMINKSSSRYQSYNNEDFDDNEYIDDENKINYEENDINDDSSYENEEYENDTNEEFEDNTNEEYEDDINEEYEDEKNVNENIKIKNNINNNKIINNTTTSTTVNTQKNTSIKKSQQKESIYNSKNIKNNNEDIWDEFVKKYQNKIK